MAVKKTCAALVGILALSGGACAEDPLSDAILEARQKPVVVEMFLSQSCKKSPPAARLMHEIARRGDVVALSFHVDYWNDFPSHGAGSWVDPFAQPAFGERQRKYTARIRRSAMVSTPQAVIDGVFHAVGSNREGIGARITEARFVDEKAHLTPPTLDLARHGEDMIRVRIDGVGAPFDAYVVFFQPKAVTKIEGGDNAGSIFDEINVVTGVTMLTAAAEGAQNLSFDAPGDGDKCAVLVQERDQGRIVAARYCSEEQAN